MPIPFLNSIKLNKNQVEDFCVYNISPDPTLTSAGDFGYLWLNTSDSPKTLKWWDGANIRSIVDSTNISSFTSGLATDLAGGGAGQVVYQNGSNDTQFLAAGSAGQVLSSNGSSAPSWLNQSSLSVGSATTATTANAVANALTAGTYLTSGGTYDGSVARTFAVDATSANTASRVVARDASGNFAAGTITAATVTGLSAPTLGSDATNKDYVDGVVQGLDIKASCLVATTTDITLSAPGAVTIDGIYSATDFTAGTTRILVKDQSAPAENGIYIWQGPAAAMTRSADANTWDELVAAFTFIERGTANADSGWVCNVNAGGTLGTTAVTWTKFSQAGSYTQGRGMVLSGGAFNFAQNSDYTAGRIPFAKDADEITFSANLHWDNSNNRLGIGTASPVAALQSTTNIVASNHDFTASFVAPTVGLMAANDSGSAWIRIATYKANATHDPYLNFLTSGGQNWSIGIDNSASDSLKFAMANGFNGTNEFLTLDTSGYLYTAANGRIGVGVSPTYSLDVVGSGKFSSSIGVGVNPEAGYAITTNGNIGLQLGSELRLINADNSSAYSVKATGTGGGITLNFNVPGIGDRLYLNYNGYLYTAANGRIGVGVVPTYPIDSVGLIRTSGTGYDGAGSPTVFLRNTTATTGRTFALNSFDGGGFQIFDVTASNATRLIIDPSGNLGLGVTPSAWQASVKALQLSGAALSSFSTYVGFLSANAYNDGSWRYVSAQGAALYEINANSHIWRISTNAPTVNGAISFTQAMTLDASGNLALGTATAFFRADIQNSTGSAILRLKGGSGSAQGSAVYMTYAGSANTLLGIGDRATILGGTPDQLACIYSGVSLTFEVGAAERLRIKSTGQLNFTGLAADPAGAAGDLYYSTGNYFKYHNGTAWQTMVRKVSVVGGAGTGTYIDAAHNFNTKTVSVTVLRTTDNVVVFTDVAMTDDNTVRVTFASTVTLANYTVTVIG